MQCIITMNTIIWPDVILLTRPRPPAFEPLIDLISLIWPLLWKFMGKWYDVALASTCPWMKRHKADAAIGSVELQSSGSSQTISMTRISRRYSTSNQHTAVHWTDPAWQALCVYSADMAPVSPSVENISWPKPLEDFITTSPVSSAAQRSITEHPCVISLLFMCLCSCRVECWRGLLRGSHKLRWVRSGGDVQTKTRWWQNHICQTLR